MIHPSKALITFVSINIGLCYSQYNTCEQGPAPGVWKQALPRQIAFAHHSHQEIK